MPTKSYYLFLIFSFLSLLCQKVIATNQEKPDEAFKKQLKQAIQQAGDSFEDRFDAEVWLLEQAIRLNKIAPKISQEERLTILRLVHQEAHRFSLDPLMVLSLITVESHFDQFAISKVGARGLMQIMPFWKDEIGKAGDNLFDIQTNLQYGCAILSIYLKREKMDMTKALARYNGSIGKTWYPLRVYKAKRTIWK